MFLWTGTCDVPPVVCARVQATLAAVLPQDVRVALLVLRS